MPSITIDVNRLDYAIGFWRTSIRHPVNLFLFGALGCCLAIQQISMHETTPTMICLALIAGFITATLVLAFSVAVTTLAMTIIARGDRGILGEHVFRFVEGGLVESTTVNETLMKWGGVRAVHRTRGYFYIRVTRSTAHIIPRRCFADAAADDEFWKAMQPLVAKKDS